jgi:hypothetical protein
MARQQLALRRHHANHAAHARAVGHAVVAGLGHGREHPSATRQRRAIGETQRHAGHLAETVLAPVPHGGGFGAIEQPRQHTLQHVMQ